MTLRLRMGLAMMIRDVMIEAGVDEVTAMQAVAAQTPGVRYERRAFQHHDDPAIIRTRRGRWEVVYYVGDYMFPHADAVARDADLG